MNINQMMKQAQQMQERLQQQMAEMRVEASAGEAVASTHAAVIRRPATCCAIDSSQARCCSNVSRRARWFGENVNVTRSPATSIFCACATTML